MTLGWMASRYHGLFELVKVGRAPGIILDKVAGGSMMTLIARNPFAVSAKTQEPARLYLAAPVLVYVTDRVSLVQVAALRDDP